MAKVQIKSEKITLFGGIFLIIEQFDALLSKVIDSTIGKHFQSFGYSEILRSLMCVFFCFGSYIEDVSTHLMRHLSSRPRLSTCSADTILRAIKYNAKPTYKKFTGYSPGIAVICDHIVGIENRYGNTNVRFHQQDTLERIFTRQGNNGIFINRERMDCGSCSEDIVKSQL